MRLDQKLDSFYIFTKGILLNERSVLRNSSPSERDACAIPIARVSAANALVDRAYGKPAVKQEQEIVDLPPVVIELTSPTEQKID